MFAPSHRSPPSFAFIVMYFRGVLSCVSPAFFKILVRPLFKATIPFPNPGIVGRYLSVNILPFKESSRQPRKGCLVGPKLNSYCFRLFVWSSSKDGFPILRKVRFDFSLTKGQDIAWFDIGMRKGPPLECIAA
jgi:hypothetical protein